MNESAVVVVPPGGGKVYRAFGEEALFHLTGAETGGRLCVFTETTPPGGGPPPHWHDNEDEWFVVLEGRVEFLIDGAWREAAPGSTVFVPRGAVHTFRNAGQTPLRMLIQTAPAGFDTFFRRCSEEFAKPGPPDMDRVMAISAEHGIHFVTGDG